MRRLKREDFFTDLALLAANDFFADCDELTLQAKLALKKELRYRARRQANAVKARRVHARFQRVMAFDPWRRTQHIQPDVFGDTHARIEKVKELSNKKLRILWVLWAMYHQWMFDTLAPGSKRYGKRYSAYRRLWYKYQGQVTERVKQEKWDRKREAVRNRRAKVKKLKRKGLSAEEILARLKDYKAPDKWRTIGVIDDMDPAEWKMIGPPDVSLVPRRKHEQED